MGWSERIRCCRAASMTSPQSMRGRRNEGKGKYTKKRPQNSCVSCLSRHLNSSKTVACPVEIIEKQKNMAQVDHATPITQNAPIKSNPLLDIPSHHACSMRLLNIILKGGRYCSRRRLDGAQFRSTPALSTLPARDVEPERCRGLVGGLLSVG